ncbi:hydrolase [Mycobacterium sp. ACS4054]|uniref:alpha/beta fold hydrolase n=1 Tax=Mycobacterium sp. ACS4054 TaxID=1834119 RepID=UPI0007FFA75D|nr:alpha/beta fold hydrolase [Mycobacterium sp. ACS4054]OBF03466.1 hydrolase [Mycobacterium sp. ACS4054]
MASDRPALVLLHGLTASGLAWQDVIPQLSSYHQVYAPTAPGHRGGPAVQRRPVTVDDMVDWAEHYLDEQGLQRPHLAGHSMGGFLAIELARRGRAATVCAFAPGGFWATGDGLRAKSMAHVHGGRGALRMARPIMPLMLKSARARRLVFQTGACHGDRISARRGVEILDDFLGCTVADEVGSSDDQQIAPLDSLPCPVTVVWSEKDVAIPVAWYEANARERLPGATFLTLPDAGHDPMMDDPELVARTILSVTAAQSPA